MNRKNKADVLKKTSALFFFISIARIALEALTETDGADLTTFNSADASSAIRAFIYPINNSSTSISYSKPA